MHAFLLLQQQNEDFDKLRLQRHLFVLGRRMKRAGTRSDSDAMADVDDFRRRRSSCCTAKRCDMINY